MTSSGGLYQLQLAEWDSLDSLDSLSRQTELQTELDFLRVEQQWCVTRPFSASLPSLQGPHAIATEQQKLPR